MVKKSAEGTETVSLTDKDALLIMAIMRSKAYGL